MNSLKASISAIKSICFHTPDYGSLVRIVREIENRGVIDRDFASRSDFGR